jgi:hypothetical protein
MNLISGTDMALACRDCQRNYENAGKLSQRDINLHPTDPRKKHVNIFKSTIDDIQTISRNNTETKLI